MRFFVKKSQKDKKSGLYLSYFYTVYTYQKHGKLDTLLIHIGANIAGAGTVVSTERSSPGNFKVYIIHLLRFNRYSCAILGFLSQPKGKT